LRLRFPILKKVFLQYSSGYDEWSHLMNEKSHYFDHEKLDVYQTTLKFVVLTNEIIESLPRGRGYLADQLQRASTSILLNIAEGAGELSCNEKVRFYRMARRSATECAGIIAIIQNLELTRAELQQQGRSLLLRVVSMLSKMVHISGNGSENANANVHE
jgi:four helix bundle protein